VVAWRAYPSGVPVRSRREGSQHPLPVGPRVLLIITVAFVVWGLRELGEPARKALIVSLLPAHIRAQGIGLFEASSIAVCWASLIGALVWFWLGPQARLYLAFAFGCAGAAVFYLYARESDARVELAPVKSDSPID
jgi:hypothetical protein